MDNIRNPEVKKMVAFGQKAGETGGAQVVDLKGDHVIVGIKVGLSKGSEND